MRQRPFVLSHFSKYRMVFTRLSTRMPSRIFGGGSMPHIQGLRNPPQNKIASVAVITTRSIRALSRVKSTTETKNSASRGIRVTLAIVVNQLNSPVEGRFNRRISLCPPLSGLDSSGAELQAPSLERERVRPRPCEKLAGSSADKSASFPLPRFTLFDAGTNSFPGVVPRYIPGTSTLRLL